MQGQDGVFLPPANDTANTRGCQWAKELQLQTKERLFGWVIIGLNEVQ